MSLSIGVTIARCWRTTADPPDCLKPSSDDWPDCCPSCLMPSIGGCSDCCWQSPDARRTRLAGYPNSLWPSTGADPGSVSWCSVAPARSALVMFGHRRRRRGLPPTPATGHRHHRSYQRPLDPAGRNHLRLRRRLRPVRRHRRHRLRRHAHRHHVEPARPCSRPRPSGTQALRPASPHKSRSDDHCLSPDPARPGLFGAGTMNATDSAPAEGTNTNAAGSICGWKFQSLSMAENCGCPAACL